ncbi:hypothetical protein ES705_10018 [subsurface metagenome]
MRNKDKDKIIEIEPFEIGLKSKKQLKKDEPIKKPHPFLSLEYENNDILNFNLHVDFTKIIQYKEGVGNYDLVYSNGEIAEFIKVQKGQGRYKAIDYNKKSFFLTLSANCPKCQHGELLIDDYDNIHSALLDLEDDLGDKFLYKDEGTEVISKFSVKAKIKDEYDEIFDIDLKCLKCSKEFFWYLTEDNESEVCDKIRQFKIKS